MRSCPKTLDIPLWNNCTISPWAWGQRELLLASYLVANDSTQNVYRDAFHWECFQSRACACCKTTRFSRQKYWGNSLYDLQVQQQNKNYLMAHKWRWYIFWCLKPIIHLAMYFSYGSNVSTWMLNGFYVLTMHKLQMYSGKCSFKFSHKVSLITHFIMLMYTIVTRPFKSVSPYAEFIWGWKGVTTVQNRIFTKTKK